MAKKVVAPMKRKAVSLRGNATGEGEARPASKRFKKGKVAAAGVPPVATASGLERQDDLNTQNEDKLARFEVRKLQSSTFRNKEKILVLTARGIPSRFVFGILSYLSATFYQD